MLEQPGDGLRPFVLGGMHKCFLEDVPRDVACRQTVQPSDVGGVGSVQVRLGDQPTVPIEEALEPHIDAMLRVTAAKPLDGYKLEIEFNDGVVRVVDCSFLLHGTLGEPLKDLDTSGRFESMTTLGRSSGPTGSIRRQNSSTEDRNQSMPSSGNGRPRRARGIAQLRLNGSR